MPSCLDNIISISGCAGREKSISGFDLMDAPEISPKNLDNVANEWYVKGIEMAKAKVDLAITQVRNDFIGVLGTSRISTNVYEPVYNTATKKDAILPTSLLERGTTLYRNAKIRDRIRKVQTVEIEVFPVNSVSNVPIKIYDGGKVSTYTVNLTGGQVNGLEIDYMMQSSFIRVLIAHPELQLYSTYITCMIGCNGTTPNDCGHAKGWDGTKEVKDEGYGINVKFKCTCDYEQILCDMAKGYMGEIVYTKARINIVEAAILSNRFNNFVIHSGQTLKEEVLPALKLDYNNLWERLMLSLPDLLQQYQSECLNCRDIKVVSNGF